MAKEYPQIARIVNQGNLWMVCKGLTEETIPKRSALGNLLQGFAQFAIVVSFNGDVGHRNHSHELVVFVDDWNTPHLLVRHLVDDVYNAIVRPDGVNVDGHDVLGASGRALFAFGDAAHDDVAVGDEPDEFAARVVAIVVLAIGLAIC
jgi:hypothetical protein